MLIVCTLDIRCKWKFISSIFFPQIYNFSLLMGTTSDKFQMCQCCIVPNTLPVLLKIVKIIKKKSLRNIDSQEGTEEM